LPAGILTLIEMRRLSRSGTKDVEVSRLAAQ